MLRKTAKYPYLELPRFRGQIEVGLRTGAVAIVRSLSLGLGFEYNILFISYSISYSYLSS